MIYVQTLEYRVHQEPVCNFQVELAIVPSLACNIQMKWSQGRCENSWETEADELPNMKQRVQHKFTQTFRVIT